MSFGNLTEDNNFVDVILVCEDGQWMEGHKFILSGWALGRLINYLSNTITNSNNDININQQRYRIFIDFWGRGCSETVRSVQIKPGDLSGGVHIVTLMTVEHYRY